MSYSVNVLTASSPYKVEVNASTTPYKVDIKVGPEVDARKYATEAKESASEALASKQAAAQSEANASQSETNAAQSEANALASEQSASTDAQTATTQAGIATTKAGEAATSASNALTSEQNAAASETNAETAATQAIAAKDEITNKIDFTGLVEGDILRHNGTELVKISEVDFLKSKVPFEKSPSAPEFTVRQLYAWDSFQRPDSLNPGVSDSGHNWFYVRQDPSSSNRIQNGVLRTQRSDILAIPTGFGSVKIEATFIFFYNLNSRASLFIGKDVNNFYELDCHSGSSTPLGMRKNINGVFTSLASKSANSFNLKNSDNIALKMTLIYTHNGFGNDCVLVGYLNDYPEQKIVIDVSADFSTFATDQDVAFAGIGRLSGLTVSGAAEFYDVKITKLKE